MSEDINQMLLEACDDALKAFRLLRIGMAHEPKAIEVIDAHISELEYAIDKAIEGDSQIEGTQ